MRRRILLAIGGTLLVMLIIISLASSAILLESYAGLERRYMERDAQRIGADISRQAQALGRSVEDNAAWTDLYRFVQHPTSAFTQTNFTAEGAANLHLDVVIILDIAGKIVYSRSYGTGTARAGIVDNLSPWIASHPGQVRFQDKTGKAEGIIGLPQGLLVFASRPIVDDLRSLPVDGTLIMGRLFDANQVRELGNRLLVTVSVYPLEGSAVPESVRGVLPRVTPDSPVYIDTTRGGMASVYSLLRDIEGVSVAIVQVDSPRDIMQQGKRTVRFFYIWLFLVGAGFCGVVILTIERTVLSRLMHLGRSVLAIGTGGDPTKRVAIAGKDQIAYIGAAINGMLDAQAKATEQLRASERRIEAFLDAVPDAIFRVTRDGTILDARSPRQLPLLEAANDLVGRDAEMILSLYSFLSPELFDKSIAATGTVLDTGVPQMLAFHVDAASGRRWYEERFVASSESEVIVLVREVTDLKQAEEARRKEILLKEIHHRVKNNLQVISSLLALQAGATKDAHTRALLQESRNRVHSMALIHEKLYQSADERGASFNAYVSDLAAHLRHSYAGNAETVTMDIDVDEITLDMDVLVPCGLIINELLSNALKYAFPEGRTGTISVTMRKDAAEKRAEGTQMLVLTVSDNGVGLPADVDIGAPVTLGLRILNTLVSQLHGTLAVDRGPGATFTLTFPQG
ncbi:MAG: CHASE4 domain-containing protein [Spirochaetia bacterium]|jgi:two-component sensor histidine kinase/sensor domain CHASE-containing protein